MAGSMDPFEDSGFLSTMCRSLEDLYASIIYEPQLLSSINFTHTDKWCAMLNTDSNGSWAPRNNLDEEDAISVESFLASKSRGIRKLVTPNVREFSNKVGDWSNVVRMPKSRLQMGVDSRETWVSSAKVLRDIRLACQMAAFRYLCQKCTDQIETVDLVKPKDVAARIAATLRDVPRAVVLGDFNTIRHTDLRSIACGSPFALESTLIGGCRVLRNADESLSIFAEIFVLCPQSRKAGDAVEFAPQNIPLIRTADVLGKSGVSLSSCTYDHGAGVDFTAKLATMESFECPNHMCLDYFVVPTNPGTAGSLIMQQHNEYDMCEETTTWRAWSIPSSTSAVTGDPTRKIRKIS